MQETHGLPPPSHSTLISADLCGSGVIAGQSSSGFQPLLRTVRAAGETGRVRSAWMTRTV
ncbi:hypothetical protein [Oligosphaera ethanolica]|uniref:hypothetical protein n=1 Tax=Oligosphaera ethanolica TaxID=760260 RepID=UPI0027D8EFC8|nr:hypothetical protein [Oligosphaera ethanolica]